MNYKKPGGFMQLSDLSVQNTQTILLGQIAAFQRMLALFLHKQESDMEGWTIDGQGQVALVEFNIHHQGIVRKVGFRLETVLRCRAEDLNPHEHLPMAFLLGSFGLELPDAN